MKAIPPFNKKRQEAGFSLVEMAIVLVIIGLIVSAIGVGNSTMRKAEANKVVHQHVIPFMARAINENVTIASTSYTVGDVTMAASSAVNNTGGTVTITVTASGTTEGTDAGFGAIQAAMAPAGCTSPTCIKTVNVAKISSTSPN